MLTRRAMLGQISAAGTAAWLGGSDIASAADRSAIDFDIPRGACDCHVHVFGDPGEISVCGEARSTRRRRPRSRNCSQLQQDLRMDRVVVVQPSVYGSRQFLHRRCRSSHGRAGARHRGDRQVDVARGARGDEGRRHPRRAAQSQQRGKFRSGCCQARSRPVAEQIRGLGWHVQMYTRLNVISALKDHLRNCRSRWCSITSGGRRQRRAWPGRFRQRCSTSSNPADAYVKISGAYRVSEKAPGLCRCDAACAGAGRGQSRRHRLGHRLAASEWRSSRRRPLTEIATPFDIDDGLLLNQLAKWVPGCSDSQEDPGRQSGAALRLRAGRGLSRQECLDLGTVGRACNPTEARALERGRSCAETHRGDRVASFRQGEREGAVKDVARAERVDRRDGEGRHSPRRLRLRARRCRPGPFVTAKKPRMCVGDDARAPRRDRRGRWSRAELPMRRRRAMRMSNRGSLRSARRSPSKHDRNAARARAACRIGATNSGKRLSASTTSTSATDPCGVARRDAAASFRRGASPPSSRRRCR